MKKAASILLFLFFCLPLAAQKTKMVTRRFAHTRQVAEQYAVLKSDERVKHGTYLSYFRLSEVEYKKLKRNELSPEQFIRQKGAYRHGKKHGEWVEYSRPGLLSSRGSYLEDEKTGIWETYKEQGQVAERYDHDKKEKLKPLIQVAIAYPEQARKARVEGKVVVSYRINTDCSIDQITVEKKLDPDCDRAAIDLIKKIGALSRIYDWECEERAVKQEFVYQLK